MSLSRKEFFRQGFFTLGDTLLKTVGAVPSGESQESGKEPEIVDDGLPRHAEAVNEYCLARSCGCFSCIERCENQAIAIIPGVGIKVDASLCVGCGVCCDVCPVTPKAVRLICRENLENQPG